ncbi:radical SAM protein [Nostoc sp. CHAB 5784]|uniref:radical SAM/SPASM domain-containing protein n=1 Tax=Nostoc mirabile TaxID=2907820 RepID=UPI001E42757C|nr:radical SAM protein [Nostoc mirabile]MCC5667774.1 radical SAM protein [Nostoc mirabile CHAB5784]
MITNQLTLDLNQTFPIPSDITHHFIDNRHLFIATTVPTWIVLDDVFTEVITRMHRGANLKDSLYVLQSYGFENEAATKKLKSLLRLLVAFDFTQDASQKEQTEYGVVQLHLTNQCNLSCPHCYVSSGKPFSYEIGLQECKDILNVMREKFEKVHVTISGGEPLTVPWLNELLVFAKQKHNFETAIITNGLLWTKQKAEALAPYLDFAAVSLDGASATIHDAIRGRGTFEQTIRNIEVMNSFGIRIALNITVMQRNKEDLVQHLHSLVSSFNFEVDVNLGDYVAEGRGEDNPDEKLSSSEFREILSHLVEPFLRNKWKPFPTPKRSNCGYGKSFAVYANGDVSPCLSPRFIRGNILRNGVRELFEAIAQEADDASVERLPLCRTCDLKYLCGGKCHLNHFIHTRIMQQNDCPSSYREDFYRSLIKRFDSTLNSYKFLLDTAEEVIGDRKN